MSTYLEGTLRERGTSINRYLNSADGVFVCRCYPSANDLDISNQGERIFEVSSSIKYSEL